jgi:hypothetical protein
MLIDVFRHVPLEARRENLAAYQAFLNDRDGALDLDKKQLRRREEGMLRYEKPLPRIRDIDRELFAKQYQSFDPKAEMAPELLLLLALVKMNAAEAYAVNVGYERTLRRAVKNHDSCELIATVEETYHTRILVSTAQLYGVEVDAAYEPPAALRGLIGTIVRSPTALARPLTLASEVLAVLMFINLLEKSRVVLRHDPELRDSVEERICEIMTDEIGHMSYNRNCVGPVGMMQARALLPMVALGLSGVFPELNALGAMSAASGDEITSLVTGRRLPGQVVQSAFVS